MTARWRFVLSNCLCWHCLEEERIAGWCLDKKIKVCDRYSHCEIACPCDYQGKKFISGAVSINRTLNSICGERRGVCLPIIPIKIYTPRGQKRVYYCMPLNRYWFGRNFDIKKALYWIEFKRSTPSGFVSNCWWKVKLNFLHRHKLQNRTYW